MLLKSIGAVSALLSVLLYFCLDTALWLVPVFFVGSFLALGLLAFGFLWLVCALVAPGGEQPVLPDRDAPVY